MIDCVIEFKQINGWFVCIFECVEEVVSKVKVILVFMGLDFQLIEDLW